MNDGNLYFWPMNERRVSFTLPTSTNTEETKEEEEGEEVGSWTLIRSERDVTERSMRSYTVKASDFELGRSWWDDSKVKDPLAAVKALTHSGKPFALAC